MRALSRRVVRIARHPRAKIVAAVAGIYIVGMLSGWFFGRATTTKNLAPENNPQAQLENAGTNRLSVRSPEEMLEQAYQRTQLKIDRDVESGKLTGKQSETIRKKASELHEAKKQTLASTDDKEELANKQSELRKEFRKWASKSKISLAYFSGLY